MNTHTQSSLSRALVFALVSILILFVSNLSTASAQVGDSTLSEEAAVDAEVTLEDLEIGEQRLLPDSPFYFLKESWRGLRHAFAFSAEADAELDLQFASEKLREAQNLAEKAADPEVVERVLSQYDQRLQRFEERVRRAEDEGRLEELQRRAWRLHIKQATALDELETRVNERVAKKITQSRERASERMAELLERADDPERAREIIERAADEVRGSRFKGLKALEVLKRVEDKVPEQARAAIQAAQDRIRDNVQERIDELPAADRVERLREYLSDLPGDELDRIRIIDDLETNLQRRGRSATDLNLDRVRDTVAERFGERLDNIRDPEHREELFKRFEQSDRTEVIDEVRNRIPDARLRRELDQEKERVIRRADELRQRGEERRDTREEAENRPRDEAGNLRDRDTRPEPLRSPQRAPQNTDRRPDDQTRQTPPTNLLPDRRTDVGDFIRNRLERRDTQPADKLRDNSSSNVRGARISADGYEPIMIFDVLFGPISY